MRDMNITRVTGQGSGLAARMLAAGVVVVALAGAAVGAQAQGMGGHGMGAGGAGPGMMMFGGNPEHVGRMVDHMLDGLNATDVQRTQIKQIAAAAAADMKAQHEAGRGLRDKGVQIFSAPTVDAGAAETLRQQMLVQHDQVSKRALQAMLDVSKVLTPEQRAKAGERMKQRQAMMQERSQRWQREQPSK